MVKYGRLILNNIRVIVVAHTCSGEQIVQRQFKISSCGHLRLLCRSARTKRNSGYQCIITGRTVFCRNASNLMGCMLPFQVSLDFVQNAMSCDTVGEVPLGCLNEACSYCLPNSKGLVLQAN